MWQQRMDPPVVKRSCLGTLTGLHNAICFTNTRLLIRRRVLTACNMLLALGIAQRYGLERVRSLVLLKTGSAILFHVLNLQQCLLQRDRAILGNSYSLS